MRLFKNIFINFFLLHTFNSFEIDDLSKIKSCGDFSVEENPAESIKLKRKSCKYSIKSENGSAIKIKLHGLSDSYRTDSKNSTKYLLDHDNE